VKFAVVFRALILFAFVVAYAGGARGQTIASPTISPSSAPVGVGSNVTVTARITDPTLVPASVKLQLVDALGRATVIGDLHDDGLDGDLTANDQIFSIRFIVYQEKPTTQRYRVSAAFAGRIVRVFSKTMNFAVTGSEATGVTFTQPANLAFVSTSPIVVSGTVGDRNASVTINGIQASKNDDAFQASIPLSEGNNILTAVASNANGTSSTASIQVTLDTTPPRVTVETPADGSRTTESAITVTGIINDIVVGTVNSQQARVTVNGVNASIANRSFTAPNVALQLGDNNIAIVGRDQVGNSANVNLLVVREAITQPYIRLVSGNNQTGVVGSQLANPLVVQLRNGATPVPNTPVVFKVTENDGLLQPAASQLIVVNTDAQGNALARLTLGNRAGAGNNAVEAYASNFQGTAIFVASGTPKPAGKINVDSGNNQFGPVNQQLPLPFVAVVTDQAHNRLSGVAVTFTVKDGGGKINGGTTYAMRTDSDGRALALLTLGTQPGQDNNVVEANFRGNSGFPAAFTASAKVPGDPNQTSISGVVLDNSNNPIPNVTMRVFRFHQGSNNNQPQQVGDPVATDNNGMFKIQPAPVGFHKLMADGTTATQDDKLYPTLEYDIVTVAGQDNTVGSPIYLPELDPLAELCVDETTGGVLRLSSSPGFSLTIAPGAATFPGGSKTGCITVTPVNPDKVPMVPGFGQQPRYVVTIQPVGTTFNPPAAITIPNMDGLAPNAKTEMYSYDHDLAAFVAIGSASVSVDGSVIASDPGVGVIKAGWHCGGNPNTSGSAGHCNVCEKCQGSACARKAINEVNIAIVNPAANQRVLFESGTENPDSPSLPRFVVAGSGAVGRKNWKLKVAGVVPQSPQTAPFSLNCTMTCNADNSDSTVLITTKECTSAGTRSLIGGGADLEVTVCDLEKESVRFKLAGSNPAPESVKTYIRSVESKASHAEVLIHLACHEPNVSSAGKYRHYRTSDGQPLFNTGGDGGFGIMQVTDPAYRSCAAIWDWRTNVDKGLNIWSDKLRQARTLEGNEANGGGIKPNKKLRACLDSTGQSWSELLNTGKVPSLTDAQRLRETVRRYNGGKEHTWSLSEEPGPWTDCSKGAWISEPRTIGDKGYVDKVYACQ
jgi:hypothetical protein